MFLELFIFFALKFTLVFTHEQSSMCGGAVLVHVRARENICVQMVVKG